MIMNVIGNIYSILLCIAVALIVLGICLDEFNRDKGYTISLVGMLIACGATIGLFLIFFICMVFHLIVMG